MTNSTGLPLPPNWIAVRLSDVCEINPRPAPDEIPDPDTEVTFVPMAAVDEIQGEIVRPESRQYRKVAKGFTPFRNNDVLFAKITPSMENGKAAIANNLLNGIGFGSTEFHVLRPSEVVLAEWVFAFIRQDSFRANARRNFVGSAGQQRVPADFLERTYIPLPSLPEQRRIVAILRQADDLRRERREIDEQAKQLLPALFQEMFDGFDTDGRFEMRRLNEVAEVVSGVAKGRRITGSVTVPYVRVANVQAGYLDLSEIKMIEALPSEVEELSLRKGDVLLTEGGDFDKLGRGAMLEADLPNTIHQNHVFRVRVNPTYLSPMFLANYLQMPFARTYFLRAAKKTSNLASMNLTQLKNLPVPIPDLALQQEFEQRLALVRQVESEQTTGSKQFDELIQSLLARVYNGELTAIWREAHLEELRQAAEERDRLLAQRGQVVVSPSVKPEVVEVTAGLDVTHPRYALLRELSPAQYAVHQAAQQETGYFTAETLANSRSLDAEITRETLPLLEAVGLIARVNLVSDESLETDRKQPTRQLRKIAYAPIYRALRSEDDSRNADLEALEIAYPEFRQVRSDLEAGKSLST